MNSGKELEKKTVKLREEQIDQLDNLKENIGVNSRNSLIRRAIDFYVGKKGWKK